MILEMNFMEFTFSARLVLARSVESGKPSSSSFDELLSTTYADTSQLSFWEQIKFNSYQVKYFVDSFSKVCKLSHNLIKVWFV